MATGKKPDPRREKTSVPHSTYLKVENGKKYGGWSAGEYYGCYSHRHGETRGCSANITDDALPCPHCVNGDEAVWRAWVPLWDTDWTLRHVLIGKEIAPSVDAIPYREPILLTRGKPVISPLVIRESAEMVNRQLPAGLPWSQPVCMLAICLVLWDMPALTRWCCDKNLLALGPRTIDQCGPATKAGPKEKKSGIAPYTAPVDRVVDAAQPLGAAMNRIKVREAQAKPSTNGDGKHA